MLDSQKIGKSISSFFLYKKEAIILFREVCTPNSLSSKISNQPLSSIFISVRTTHSGLVIS